MALSEENLGNVIFPEKRDEWNALPSADSTIPQTLSVSMQQVIYFSRACCNTQKKHDRKEPGLFEEEFRCTELLCLCTKTYCC